MGSEMCIRDRDILVDVRRHWTGVEVLDGGTEARIRPGTSFAIHSDATTILGWEMLKLVRQLQSGTTAIQTQRGFSHGSRWRRPRQR